MQPEDFERSDPLLTRGLAIVLLLIAFTYFYGPQTLQIFSQLIHRDKTILKIKAGEHELTVSGH